MENHKPSTYIDEKSDAEDIKRLLMRYLKYWPWFVLSVVVFVGLAFAYLRYTEKVYQTTAKIQILKDDTGLDLSGLRGGNPLIDMSKVNLENESEILKSRRITQKVVANLDLQTKVYKSGQFKSSEIWGEQIPFTVKWDDEEFKNTNSNLIEVDVLDATEFEITEEKTGFSGTFNFGETVTIEDPEKNQQFKFQIQLKNTSEEFSDVVNSEYSIQYIGFENAVSKLSEQVNVENLGDRSEILQVSLSGQNKQKNEDVVNTLIHQFNEDGKEDNRQIANRTEEFVIERLKFLDQELDTVETDLVDFKTKNELVTIESNAQVLFTKNTEAEMRYFELAQQLSLLEDFKQELEKTDEFQLLPANIGIEDDAVNKFTEEYNNKVLERQDLLVSSTDEDPQIVAINKRLDRIRENIYKTVEVYERGLKISMRQVAEKENKTRSGISSLPSKEKQIRNITRQRLVKEELFVFLLQKREEAALTSAVVSDIAKVVDFAYTAPNAISPKPKIILLASVLLGLLIPFGILYVVFLLDTKINNKDEINSGLGGMMPIVGEIPMVGKRENTIVAKNDNSALAESFRILRTNLNFMGLSKSKKSTEGKVILVTSTTKGEGKTFTAVNLAATIASTKNKVLLVGADLRNPQVHNYLGFKKTIKGLSQFLVDDTTSLTDIKLDKVQDKFDFDVVLSGDIPPNPSELLLNGRFEEFVEQAKSQYDYVIIDSAPTILVTDSVIISDSVDATLYMIRAGVTDTQLLEHIRDTYKKSKLKNIGIVFNGLSSDGAYAYNYGYGYGYQVKTKGKRNRLKFW
ncbi:MAG: GumC family protein [Bacteroidota bacterium]